jgi:hypothetical protein
MICAEAVHALAAAGVTLSEGVCDMNGGEPMLALFDAIGLADEQRVVLPAPLIREVRALFDQLPMRPESKMHARVDEALRRVEQRAVAGAATVS